MHCVVGEFGEVQYRPGDALLHDALWRADAGAFRSSGNRSPARAWVKRGGASVPGGIEEALDALERRAQRPHLGRRRGLLT